MSKIFVWANSDLDGACSTILLGNIFPNMDYKSVFFGDFLNQYTDWEHNLENYDLSTDFYFRDTINKEFLLEPFQETHN
jgi:hypothetical protein